MNKLVTPRIFVAGHSGLVGSAIVRRLRAKGDCEIVLRDHCELDLVRQGEVDKFFKEEHIDQVYLAAGRVGGIHANNTYPTEYIYLNLMMEANIIHAAYVAGVQKLLFLGSSCIYPREAPQPITESALLTGILETTNEPYAVAKIAGIKLCESYNRQYGTDYRSVMPTNLYGPHDNFHPDNSHVIPALMRRFHEGVQAGAETVTIWGSGTPLREFLHVDDMAAACVFVMDLDAATYRAHTQPMLSHINVGIGVDCSIRELAETLARVTGFAGRLVFNASKPDGTPRKLLDVSRIAAMGWRANIPLEQGLSETYRWFVENQAHFRE
jgi:GDP-L-fucose synthase